MLLLGVLAVGTFLETLVEWSELAQENQPLDDPEVIVLRTCVDAIGQESAAVDMFGFVLCRGVAHCELRLRCLR